MSKASPEPHELRLFFAPPERLRLTVGEDRSYPTVKPVWAAPLTRPGRYLGLLDAKGDEIATVAEPASLSEESRAAVMEELRRRTLTSTIVRIEHAKVEFGATYWHTITDRGERDFVTQSLQENAQWLGPTHLLLIDVDGNRFEIPDVDALDAKSRGFVQAIL
jgi:hypothetical protein